MPENLSVAAFTLGAILLLLALSKGGVKLAGIEVESAAGAVARTIAGLAGAVLIVLCLLSLFGILDKIRPDDDDPCASLPVDQRPLECLEEKP